MRTFNLFASVTGLLVVCVSAPTFAQNAGADATARAAAIAPFVDEQTFAIGHIDLAAFDAKAAAAKLSELAILPQQAAGELSREAAFVEHLKKVGVNELFGAVSIADLPRAPGFAVFVASPDVDLTTVARAIRENSGYAFRDTTVIEAIRGKLVMGDREVVDRLKQSTPAARPELATAFSAAGDTTAQLLLLPGNDTRRVVRELMPQLPAQLGGGPSAPLVDGFQWAAIGVDLPPRRIVARLTIQSKDAASARDFETALVGVYAAVAKQLDVQALVPTIDKLIKLMTPKVEGDRLVVALSDERGDFQTIAVALAKPLATARASAGRAQGFNNLKQLGLAMHNYYDVHRSLPAAALRDKDGKPLLSWRVSLLPYLEQDALYKEFHLDEPWDSEHNRKLIDRMPAVFRSPSSKVEALGRTTYLLPMSSTKWVGGREAPDAKTGNPSLAKIRNGDEPDSLFFGGPKGGTFPQIPDGTSATILIVDADDAHAVIWTKPEDLEVDLNEPLKGLENKETGGFSVGYFDGSAHFLPNTIDKKKLRALLTPAGGEVVER